MEIFVSLQKERRVSMTIVVIVVATKTIERRTVTKFVGIGTLIKFSASRKILRWLHPTLVLQCVACGKLAVKVCTYLS